MTSKLKDLMYPLVTAAAVILVWQLSIQFFHIPSYVLPTPLSVLRALETGYIGGVFWQHLAYTMTSTIIGYVVGCGLAILVGALVSESEVAEKLVHPLIIALQSMPKVALAPLILVWFGFELKSKVIMVALVCFFPVFVNTIVGLKQTNPAMVDMAKAISASRWMIFWEIKLPSAAGHIFAGLQIAIVLSLIGAVVAEFVSSSRGLGYLINSAAVTLEVNVMFAALVSLAVLGIVGTQLVRYAHRKLIFWEGNLSSTVKE